VLKIFTNIVQITPEEVWYDRITFSPGSMTLSAYAASLPGFGQFLTSIQGNPMYQSVRIGKLESSSTKGAQMQFDLSVTVANGAAAKGAKK
jgi:hypothetical protein